MHICPDCGGSVPGPGRAPCDACSLARRISKAEAESAAGIAQEWARSLFERFCASSDLRKARGDMPKHIRSYASFFASLGIGFASAKELSQSRLLQAFGAEGLRRQFQAVRFIATTLDLAWDEEAAERAIEGTRVDATLSRHADAPWATDLGAYRKSLLTGKPISPRTERMYVAAAAELLANSGVERASALTEALVRRHLRRKPGQDANLNRFLTWADAAGGRVKTPPEPKITVRKREKLVMERVAALLSRLACAEDPREGRALLVGTISCVCGVPLLHVLRLRVLDVSVGRQTVTLRLPRGSVTLTSQLAEAFVRFAAARGVYAFPGRNTFHTAELMN